MSLKFSLGTPAYCREILAWLEQEHAESGGGFFCKAATITEYFQEQNALCALIDDRVVAFAVFYVAPPASGISVTEVHPAFRGRCFGRQLLQETLSTCVRRARNMRMPTAPRKRVYSYSWAAALFQGNLDRAPRGPTSWQSSVTSSPEFKGQSAITTNRSLAGRI